MPGELRPVFSWMPGVAIPAVCRESGLHTFRTTPYGAKGRETPENCHCTPMSTVGSVVKADMWYSLCLWFLLWFLQGIMDTLPKGHFAYWTVLLLYQGHFTYKTLQVQDTSSMGHFAYWTVRLLFGHFAYKAKYINLVNFMFHFVYCLKSGESNQFAWRLIKVPSQSICMEYLLIFHIIMEHVQPWLKHDVLLQYKLYMRA